MRKQTLKLILAVAIVAFAVGGITFRFAQATPPQGFTAETIAGPARMEEIDTFSEVGDHKVRIKTKGVSDVWVTRIKIAAGGHGGWHSHPGPSIIMVKSGTATLYDDCDDFAVPHVFPAGTAFAEDAGCVHIIGNAGDTELELVVIQIVPLDAPRRIDEEAP